MSKFILTLLFLLPLTITAQVKTVVFDYEKASFNNNQPLPAETNWMITGHAGSQVSMIEVNLYASDRGKNPLYTNLWKRVGDNQSLVFYLPVNYKLKGNSTYDVKVNYFRKVVSEEKNQIMQELAKSIDAYVDMTYKLSKSKISLTNSYTNIINDLNSIVYTSTNLYRTRNETVFNGFSDIVKLKLKHINELNLNNSKFLGSKKEDKELQKSDLRKKEIEGLKELLNAEVFNYLMNDMSVLFDSKTVSNYSTEKTMNILSLNAGYGAVVFNTSADKVDYDTSPYIGISVPLGNKSFKSAFVANTAVSVGVFLANVKNESDIEYTGPVIEKPFYVGLG